MFARRSAQATKSNIGRKLSSVTRSRIAGSLLGKSFHPWKGKKLVDCVGPERAAELGHNHSERLKDGYLNGTIDPSGWTFYRVERYGCKFRSFLECAYADRLVTEGLESGVDWTYEPKEFRVEYISPVDGERHVYCPDFEVLGDIVEIKPLSQLDDPVNVAKFQVAVELAEHLAVEFRIVTEHDLPLYTRLYCKQLRESIEASAA